MNFLFKFLLLFKKFKIIAVLRDENSDIFELMSVIFKDHIESQKVILPLRKNKLSLIFKNKIIMVEIDPDDGQKLKQINFLIKKSSRSVLVLEKDLTDRELGAINFLFKAMNKKGLVIVDSKNSRKINFSGIDFFKVGFGEESDLQVSDLNVSENTNFKVNHLGDVVPFWIDRNLAQSELKSVLFTIATGMNLDLNLVEISQKLKQ